MDVDLRPVRLAVAVQRCEVAEVFEERLLAGTDTAVDRRSHDPLHRLDRVDGLLGVVAVDGAGVKLHVGHALFVGRDHRTARSGAESLGR